MDKVLNNIVVENARITFKNFSGEERQYNPAGNRNFCLLIDDYKMAEQMKEDGWAIKYLQPKEEGDDPQPYMQVVVKYGQIVPKIILITSNGQNQLDEEDINILDHADIKNIDLIIRPYNWEVNGKTGVKAYLKTMYVTIQEDELERKYANPDFDEQ